MQFYKANLFLSNDKNRLIKSEQTLQGELFKQMILAVAKTFFIT